MGNVSHSVSFLLGALLPTLLLFFLASDRVGEQLSSISSFGNGSAAHQQMSHANLPGNGEKEERLFPGLAELLPKVATDDVRHGDHHLGERGLRAAGLPAGPLPRELLRRREDRAPPRPPPRRRRRRRRLPPLPARAPALLPPRGRSHRGGAHEPELRNRLHERRLPGARLGQARAAAARPPARPQLPLHGRGRRLAPRPVPAHRPARVHGHVQRHILGRRRRARRQLAQHGLLLREGDGPHAGDDAAVAGGAAAVPAGPRADRLQPDQARAGRRPAAAVPVPRRGYLRRVLPRVPQRHG